MSDRIFTVPNLISVLRLLCIPLFVWILFGIENRLDQVLANLLDNAISFSPKNSEIIIDIHNKKDIVSLKIKDKTYNTLHFNFSSTDKKLGKDKKLNTDVWYDEETLNWVKATFEKKGKWEYKLVLVD